MHSLAQSSYVSARFSDLDRTDHFPTFELAPNRHPSTSEAASRLSWASPAVSASRTGRAAQDSYRLAALVRFISSLQFFS